MRKLVLAIVVCLFSSITLLGCAGSAFVSEDEVGDHTPEVLFADARLAMELGNFNKAADVLEALDSRYPFGPYKTQVQLDLIFAYYKLNDSAQALANVERFIRLNPTHQDIDYVHYMSGLINMQADTHVFHSIAGVDRSDRDPSFASAAFKNFETLLTSYPNSRYAPDARKRMITLRNRLANHSLAVAEYYVKMDAWVAASNRAQQLLESFPSSVATERALEILVKSYNELGQPKLQQHAKAVLAASYPNNRLAQ